MSVIQNVEGRTVGGKLALSWQIFCDAKGLLLEVASDSQMKTNLRQFLLPAVAGCELDLGGTGSWFVRVGCLIGTETKGRVEFSGTYGPFPLVGAGKTLVPLGPDSCHKVIHTQALQEGMRFHTGYLGRLWALMETWRDGKRIVVYTSDAGRGWVDFVGLGVGEVYTFRIWLFEESVLVRDRVVALAAGSMIAGKRTLGRVKYANFTESVEARANKAVLKDLAESGKVKFSDYRQYAAYLAARERGKDAIRDV